MLGKMPEVLTEADDVEVVGSSVELWTRQKHSLYLKSRASVLPRQ